MEMSSRELTALLAIGTLLAWGLWIAASGVDRNLALMGWMPFSMNNKFWLLIPTGIFAAITTLAWVTEDRWLAWTIPLMPVTGVLLFWGRYIYGMSHFGGV